MNLAKQKERELIVKFLGEKKSCRKIAELLGVSKSKVSFWSSRSRITRILDDKPRSGRPTKLNTQKLSGIRQVLAQSLREQREQKRTGFLSKEVMLLLEKQTGRTYTLRHVQRILHKMGLSLITPRSHHARNDKKKVEEFRVEFKKKLKKNMWVIPSSPSTKLDFV